MAAEYRIHKPYVLATLPRPLDHTAGRIVAREVYGQTDGSRKRKRTELVVGIDGETTSLYDIPGSRLITSYPIPPQESFTCPPYSTRVRRLASTDRTRLTYIATSDASSQKITLFKDVVHPEGKTTSTTVTKPLAVSAVQFITCTHALSPTSATSDVILVCKGGEVLCLDGDSLEQRWSASSTDVLKDATPQNRVSGFEVEHVTTASIAEFAEGMFKGRQEIYSALPKGVSPDHELILLITKCQIAGTGAEALTQQRHVMVVSPAAGATSDLQRLTTLDVAPLASLDGEEGTAMYQADPASGSLLKLQGGRLAVYDVLGPVPKLKSVVQTGSAESMTRLSRPLALSCSPDSFQLYNYQYRSMHGRAPLDLSDLPADYQNFQSCQLLTYLRSQELVVALVENLLVSIHVECPKQGGKRRKEGQLIDSIGRGTTIELPTKRARNGKQGTEFSRQVPGSMSGSYIAKFQEDAEQADQLLSNNDIAGWEEMLRLKFHMKKKNDEQPLANGNHVNGDSSDAQEVTDWEWLFTYRAYPQVDRRWVLYAISQIFSIEVKDKEALTVSLRLLLPDSNVTTYLVAAGHLTLSNLKSAFRDLLDGQTTDSKSLAGDLIQSLVDADLSMSLLLNYIESTKLGEVELLLAIKALMLAMDLISDDPRSPTKLLANSAHEDTEMDFEDLEREIAMTEHYLGDDSSSRSRGLTLAFTKLWRLPSSTVVKALRTVLKTTEVLSLIHLLRVELLRGAWTSLYVDQTSFDGDVNEPPPDGVIALISDLLGRCIDAVGAGGWLFNDATSLSTDPAEAGDFITALKLEVTAALEGIEEAVYLNGVVGEAVRYGLAAQKSGAARSAAAWNAARSGNTVSEHPITVPLEGRESRMLPLGLKAKMLPSKEKIVGGGEVVVRSTRETGHMISKKVEPYSLERLNV